MARAWDRKDWREFGALPAVIAVMHIVAFCSLALLIAPHHYHVGAPGLRRRARA